MAETKVVNGADGGGTIAKGETTQAYLVKINDTTKVVDIIEGQSGLSESITNNAEEIAAFKKANTDESQSVTWVQRTSGTRDATWSLSVTKKIGSANDMQGEMLKRLKTQLNAEAQFFVGDTDVTGKFTGEEWNVIIMSASTDYPTGSAVTGTFELANAGGAPIDHDGSKTLAEIIEAVVVG